MANVDKNQSPVPSERLKVALNQLDEVENGNIKLKGYNNMNDLINALNEESKDEYPRPSKELLETIQEGEDILSGKIKAKSYTNMYEMLKDLKR